MFYPHSVTIHAASAENDGTRVGGTSYGAGVSKTAHVQPASIRSEVGTAGPELEGLYLLIGPIADKSSYSRGDMVIWDSRKLKVMAAPKAFQCGLPTDHIEVNLEEMFRAESSS